MKTLIAAIHGIMTSQTDPSWPDKFDAWMLNRDPEVKVLKKEYRAGPWPRWNCWIKDPRLARSLANELELFLKPPTPFDPPASTPLWFVAHSNGAVIALLTAKILVERGYKIAGLILTGAACQADIAKNGILELIGRGALGAIIAYCSHDDQVLAGDPARLEPENRNSKFKVLKSALWAKLMAPYGCLGRTGWLLDGEPLMGLDTAAVRTLTRWFPGGHSTYFTRWNIERSFEQIYEDVSSGAQVQTP